jgi:hypothetical protein
MKSHREVSINNIVNGKRQRVMSSEAVSSLVAMEYTENVLSKIDKDNSDSNPNEQQRIINSKLRFK